MKSLPSALRLGLLCTGVFGIASSNAVRTQQHVWQPGPAFIPIGTPTIAYDSARQRVVMVVNDGFSGEVWEGDGAVWTRAAVGGPLSGRSYANLAFDSARGAVLMFGGAILAVYQNDLWSWNGTAWAQIVTPQAPPPRNSPVMVYDGPRARLVLYGGYITAPVDETWEFDGTTWAQQFPANRPTARLTHSLVFDQARGTTLLFGGYAQSYQSLLAETWSWNGLDWTRHFPVQSPPPRRSGGLAYDTARNRVVLNGGMNQSTVLTDTWEWDGANWGQVVTSGSSPASGVPAVCFDVARGETVHVETGIDGARTWAYDGANWAIAVESTNSLREHHAIAYDPVRDAAVCFGGAFGTTFLDQTWEFRGGFWQQMLPPTKPSAREFTALAFDPSNQQMLLFSGQFAPDDTWFYDGVTWTQRQPVTRPPARHGHALATDTGRGRVVLFGGQVGFQAPTWRNDTWEWDGSNWLLRTPAQSPPVRTNHAMAYDPLRARTVVYGGGELGITPSLADHWEWDGVAWTQIAATAAPGQRVRPGLVFDDVAGRIVLFGGYDMAWVLPLPHNDTWEWDGSAWTLRSTTNPPMARMNGAVTWLASSHRMLLNAGTVLADTWLLAGLPSIASVTPYGAPCAGSAGMPALRALGLPLRDNRWFRMQLSSVPAHALVVLGLAAGQANAPLGGGCTALVDQALLLWQIADARGSGRFGLPIPNVPVLHGAALFAQGLAVDSGGALAGLASLSGALRIVVD